MGLSVADIVKHLPKTNCKKCGYQTCAVFAIKVNSTEASIDDCPYIDANFTKIYNEQMMEDSMNEDYDDDDEADDDFETPSNSELKQRSRQGILRIIKEVKSIYPGTKILSEDDSLITLKVPVPIKEIGDDVDVNLSMSVYNAQMDVKIVNNVSKELTGQQLYEILCLEMLCGGVQILNDFLVYCTEMPLYGLAEGLEPLVFCDTLGNFAKAAANFGLQAIKITG